MVGLALVVISSFLLWFEVYRNEIGGLVTDVTYTAWDLPVRLFATDLPALLLFPLVVWWPLPLVAWAGIRALRGQRRLGRGPLVWACILGALGAFTYLLAGNLNLVPLFTSRMVTITVTIHEGYWLCLAGYGVLVLGTLILGRAPHALVDTGPLPVSVPAIPPLDQHT